MKTLKLIITAIVALVFGLASPTYASNNATPIPTLNFVALNSSTVRVFVNDSSAPEHHICPSSKNYLVGKLADGTDEWRCDVIKLTSSTLYFDYSLPFGNKESFTVVAYDPKYLGDPKYPGWSKWSVWYPFTNTNPDAPSTALLELIEQAKQSPTYTKTYPTTSPTTPLNWKQAGCDDLTKLNKEWRDFWAYTDKYWQDIADSDVDKQNNPSWNILFGEPKTRPYGYRCNNKLAWKIVKIKVQQFVWQYTLCADGWKSSSTGQGTCSWHGGIYEYRGYYKTVNANRIQFYWVY